MYLYIFCYLLMSNAFYVLMSSVFLTHPKISTERKPNEKFLSICCIALGNIHAFTCIRLMCW